MELQGRLEVQETRDIWSGPLLANGFPESGSLFVFRRTRLRLETPESDIAIHWK